MNILSHRAIIIFLPVILFLLAFTLSQNDLGRKNSEEMSVQGISSSTAPLSASISRGTTTVSIAIASTFTDRERGLSGRAFLGEGEGMLFIFDHSEAYGFWMPDMNFAIDMIWIDSNWHIVDIKENATPESYPTIFTPRAPARYVLEVPAHSSAKWGWKEGTLLNFHTGK